MPEWRERHGRWKRGGPRVRPPWWPEGETWPPAGPEGWRQLRRGFARRAATVAAVFLVMIGLMAAGVIWVISTVAGTDPLGALAIVGAVLLFALLARWVLRSVRAASVPVRRADRGGGPGRERRAGDPGPRARTARGAGPEPLIQRHERAP